MRLISDSAIAARGLLGYLDEADGEPSWHPPRSAARARRASTRDRPFERAGGHARARPRSISPTQRRDLPAGTFVFVISDFLAAPTRDDWLHALERRFEIVPVVLQDPVWEQSFPDVSGVAVPFLDAVDGTRRLAALREHEAAERREANEHALRELIRKFHALDLDPVLVSSHEHRDVVFSFLAWADERLLTRGRR